MHARLNACRARMRGFAVRPPVLELAETWNKEMSEMVRTTTGNRQTMSVKTLDKRFARFYIGTQHVQRREEYPFQLRETDIA